MSPFCPAWRKRHVNDHFLLSLSFCLCLCVCVSCAICNHAHHHSALYSIRVNCVGQKRIITFPIFRFHVVMSCNWCHCFTFLHTNLINVCHWPTKHSSRRWQKLSIIYTQWLGHSAGLGFFIFLFLPFRFRSGDFVVVFFLLFLTTPLWYYRHMWH